MVRRQVEIRHVRTVEIVGGIRPGPGAAAFQPLVHSLLTTVSASSNQEKSDKAQGSRCPAAAVVLLRLRPRLDQRDGQLPAHRQPE
ncbi:hypothetical protein [Streptomyces sp. JV184]|uniref:hypothetical protein n=1 Tax=Streptomyces sp. JV184 TaxID=858637 RepID=UPI002E77E32E|nr:hypothetical protein [Streptomyces sp. JV184]MEE1743794.1 hypothetical protein [Streptomyces sp. JV184]